MLAIGTMVEAMVSGHDREHTAEAVENGTGMQSRPFRELQCTRRYRRRCLSDCSEISMTPFGKPVVPDVYCMLMTS
jgi:hypothetical protein